jgi:hypothetical protein
MACNRDIFTLLLLFWRKVPEGSNIKYYGGQTHCLRCVYISYMQRTKGNDQNDYEMNDFAVILNKY